MTCFWDGILSKITLDEINTHLNCAQFKDDSGLVQNLTDGSTYVDMKPRSFILLLKERAPLIPLYDVIITDRSGSYPVTSQNVGEINEWIRSYDINKINEGHDCSVGDPFLTIIAHIFPFHIYHTYTGHKIEYKNTREVKRIINFSSDTGHFT